VDISIHHVDILHLRSTKLTCGNSLIVHLFFHKVFSVHINSVNMLALS